MEKTPFDGCVFHVTLTGTNGEAIKFTSNAWGRRAFSLAEFASVIDTLQATRFVKFTDNFLRVNVTPGDVDWFDDFSPIIANATIAATIANRGRCKGILFDVEPYAFPLFDFHKLSNPAKRTWNDYCDQARLRGAEYMNALQKGFPGLTVFLTFGYSIAWAQMENGKKQLQDCSYALLPSFLDGMVSAARGKARLVDGCELSYSFKERKLFRRDYRTMREGLLPIVRDRDKYQKTISIGFGLWMDFNSHKKPWSTNDFSKNYFSPAEFLSSANFALESCDEYVWIYTQTPKWWTEKGTAAYLPLAYDDALRAARLR
jgi:hypothetical protein